MTDPDPDPLAEAADLLDWTPDVLPTAALHEADFEAFTERLLVAHRHAFPTVSRRIARITLWGRRGDPQHGIDLAGAWDTGTEVAFQCKRWGRLLPGDIDSIVTAATYPADEYVLVYSGVASAPTREAVREHPGWDLWDAKDLRQLLNDLPLHQRREVLDNTWSPEIRRRILRDLPTDAFISTKAVRKSRSREGQLLNDNGAYIGVKSQRKQILRMLQNGTDGPPAIIVHGPGGTGKTRLIEEAAETFEERRPDVPVVWLGAGVALDRVALDELPLLPSVIVVDDAHLRTAALTLLLQHVVANPGTRLLLGSRDPAVEELRRQLVTVGIAAHRTGTVRTDRWSINAARRLVASLATGLSLQYQFTEQLAQLAADTPAVAVIAIGLVREGVLTDSLQLNDDLRTEILKRFGIETLDDVPGAPGQAAPTLYAIIAALGSMNFDDAATTRQLRAMTGWSVRECLIVRAALDERGLTAGEPTVRVVTELLADQILEREAIIARQDTGFVRDLWTNFANTHFGALLANLGSLDRRLQIHGNPGVIDDLWSDVLGRVQKMDHADLLGILVDGAQLAVTQPTQFIDVLDVVLARLDVIDDSDLRARPRLWFGREGVEYRLSSLYADVGVHAPDLIPRVLEALRQLGRRDVRKENPTPGHPLRLIRERFADYSALPSADAPKHLIDAVERWISEEPSPVLLLVPLMAKNTTRRTMTDHRTLTFEPVIVSPGRTASIRARIRALLESNLQLAGDSVELLKHALQPPQPGFGAVATTENVLHWEAEDLKTLTSLRFFAERADTAAVRRSVRNATDWSATHALSQSVRATALNLIRELDARPEDDLADFLIGGTTITSHLRLESGTTGSRLERLDALAADAIRSIWPDGYTAAGFHFLDTQAREVAAVSKQQIWKLNAIAITLRRTAPELVPAVTSAIVGQEPGPLDDLLPSLLADVTDEAIITATESFASLRPEVRRAFGIAASHEGWRNDRPASATLLRLGRGDAVNRVRESFLVAYDRTATWSQVRDELVAGDASAWTIDVVLDRSGFGYSDDDTAPPVASDDVPALFDLADRMTASAAALPRVLKAAASADPNAVLTFLNRPRDEFYSPDITALFAARADSVAAWLLNEASTQPNPRLDVATVAAIGEPMPRAVADALEHVAAAADSSIIDRLAEMLTAVSAWSSYQPDLARFILEHGGRVSGDDHRRALVSQGSTPTHWSWGSGGSPELNRALHAAVAGAADEPNQELRELLETAVRIMQARIDDINNEDDGEFDDDGGAG
ncbi:hypothetical protein ABRP24_004440 [Curtobacterium sp. WHRI 8282]|uniref:P-loop NTPase n=1 Tax=Curtobacterium sp. WHRI 8282 TaxID=3162559 RepID=UPI0032EC7381